MSLLVGRAFLVLKSQARLGNLSDNSTRDPVSLELSGRRRPRSQLDRVSTMILVVAVFWRSFSATAEDFDRTDRAPPSTSSA